MRTSQLSFIPACSVPLPDDGTLSPWVALGSLPFAPEIVLPTIAHYDRSYPALRGPYGFTCSLNPTFPGKAGAGWLSKDVYGLNLGPNVLMIENYYSEFVWRLTRQSQYVIDGLRRAGFRGGWLASTSEQVSVR